MVRPSVGCHPDGRPRGPATISDYYRRPVRGPGKPPLTHEANHPVEWICCGAGGSAAAAHGRGLEADRPDRGRGPPVDSGHLCQGLRTPDRDHRFERAQCHEHHAPAPLLRGPDAHLDSRRRPLHRVRPTPVARPSSSAGTASTTLRFRSRPRAMSWATSSAARSLPVRRTSTVSPGPRRRSVCPRSPTCMR
jgi:hypothetical protein